MASEQKIFRNSGILLSNSKSEQYSWHRVMVLPRNEQSSPNVVVAEIEG